jgi:hypothetical protein
LLDLRSALAVVNTTQGQRQNYSFSVDPHGEKEVGLLECNWQFEHGESGNIQVEGYTKKRVHRSLMENGRNSLGCSATTSSKSST